MWLPLQAPYGMGGLNIFNSFGNNSKGDLTGEKANQNTAPEEESIAASTDSNIRNVFLESMCFIPELVTSNSSASLNFKLADNITTWTIQTVGNTKDGKIGYHVLDHVRVFQDFFVDFELPKNAVETDKISIPVTVYNYTEEALDVILNVKEEDWFILHLQNGVRVNVAPQETKMVYVPITILSAGSHAFRVEVAGASYSDIVEKQLTVLPNGYKIEKVVSNGNLDRSISEDLLILDQIVEGTAVAKVKIYASLMAQNIEGLENIFKMPTGCFEQISSTLYPNILALKYLEDNKIVDEELKQKALAYISSGYQKLLSYEVKGEPGGYSLYGSSPAETVLTAYGLMEITDLKEVYYVDEKVIDNMTEFIYGKQKSNGSFTITGYHLGGAGSREELALNAYITWALSESNPSDARLKTSVEYLKNKLDSVNDNYTLALIANVLENVKDKEASNVLKSLMNNILVDGNLAYITSDIVDYYGSRYDYQTVQTVALTSMALSKSSMNNTTNKLLINYLISKKDTYGTWYNTQATILALKAFNELNEKNKLENQVIKVRVNAEEQQIEIKDNPLEFYELTFENLNQENKLNIDIERGNAYYEIVEEYYIPYEDTDSIKGEIEISVQANQQLRVNDQLNAKVRFINNSENSIYNGMVRVSIPQGFTVVEESLMKLESQGIIEKYEMNYSMIYLYLRDFDVRQIVELDLAFRASYPVDITGLAVRAYDYYNPTVEGVMSPIRIKVTE